MEIKRAAELSICSLLREALPDLNFFPSRGGGTDVTPVWKANHNYSVGDVIHPTDPTFIRAVVVIEKGNSGPTEPSFDDVVANTYREAGRPAYQTTAILAVLTAEDEAEPKAPFGVVAIEQGDKTLHGEETSFLQGTVIWVTRADDENVVTESDEFKRVYDAMANIGSGYDILRRIIIHGVDVTKTDDFSDNVRQSHADRLYFTIGVTERIRQG